MSLKSVLLIEDDSISALVFKRALIASGDQTNLLILDTAEKALAQLRESPVYPDLIVLDLDLPAMNGFEFLDTIKTDAQFKKIPVIILTTSSDPNHKSECFSKQAAGYFIKPLDYALLIRLILDYWMNSEFASAKPGTVYYD